MVRFRTQIFLDNLSHGVYIAASSIVVAHLSHIVGIRMERGKVKWFDAKKGFGFIERESGGDIFVHISSLKNATSLEQGAAVEFETTEGKKGPQASNVITV